MAISVTVAVVIIAAVAIATLHYDVNVEIEGEGTVEPTHTSVNVFGSAEFKIKPADGWRVSSVTVDGKPAELNNNILKINGIIGSHKVRVIFTPSGTYQLETVSEGCGSVYTAAKSYIEGDNAVVDIIPDEGYVISDVTVDGKSVGSVNRLDILMDSGHTVDVKFREAKAEDPSVDVSVDVKTGISTGAFYGTVTPSGPVRVAYGGTLVVSVSLNEGYILKSVKIDGKETGTSPIVTVKNVTESFDIGITVVSEKLKTYTITASSPAGGSISPSGTVSVGEGDSVTFTIIPDSGYGLSSLIIDGKSVSYSGRTYTFAKVSENHSISAVFTAKPAPTPSKTLESITLAGYPTEVTVNRTVSTTGMVVTAHWSDGSESQVTGYTVSPTSFSSTGLNKVTVSYGGKTAAFDINVKEEQFTVTFTALTGGSVSQSSVTVNRNTVPVLSGDSLTVGSATVTPTPITEDYLFGSWTRNDGAGITDPIAGNVTFSASFLTLTKITVVTGPAKTSYTDGDPFDKTGVKIAAEYGSKTVDVTSKCTFSPEKLTYGVLSIDVTFMGKTAKIDVTVNQRYYAVSFTATDGGSVSTELLQVAKGTVPKMVAKSLYFGSDKVTPVYNSMTSIFISWSRSDGVAISVPITGDVTFTAKFLPMTGIEVKTNPTKTVYAVGEKFNPAGMVVMANFSDGVMSTSMRVFSGYTYTPSGELSLADKQITVEYGGKTATVDISVNEVSTLDSIEITTPPSVTTFARNATVDLTGMVVTAHYTVSTYDRVITSYTVSPESFSEIGNKEITVSYTEGSITKTAVQNVTIVDTGVFSVKVTSYSGTKIVNGSAVSFSETLNKNLKDFKFDLSGISPGITQTVTLKITNGTTADLKACVFVSSMTAGSSAELAKQIILTSGTNEKSVNDAANKSFVDIGTMNKGGTQEITLTISFPHNEHNNEVMGKNLGFSLGVFADYP